MSVTVGPEMDAVRDDDPAGMAGSASGPGGGRPGRTRRFPQRKVVAWTAFVVALVAYVLAFGIPYSTDDILLWVTAALFCASISDLGRWRRGLIRDWLPLYAVLAFYSLLRGYASHLWFAAHWRPETRFDQWIGFGTAPTVRLQNAFFNPNNLHVWDYLAWCTYMTHFFASFVIAGVLWVKDHDRFRRFVPLFVGLTFAGYLTYVLYPAMPPWMVSANGSMAPSVRIIPVMWNHVGFHQAAALFEGNASFDNDVAAVPSLHAAYPMLICLFFWGRASPLAAGAAGHLRGGHGHHPRLHRRALRLRHHPGLDLRHPHLRDRLPAPRPPRRPEGDQAGGPGGVRRRCRGTARIRGHRRPGGRRPSAGHGRPPRRWPTPLPGRRPVASAR